MRMEVRGLCQGYGRDDVVSDISFTAESGELVSVLGPNGCGKSTMIKSLCNVMRPRAGTIEIDGVDMLTMPSDDLAKLIGYVPQTISSVGYTTVYDLVLIGRRPYVKWNYTPEDLRIVADSMITMNVNAYMRDDVNQLSGGQRQRAFIARALAQRPRFYVFDEPTSSFDLRNQLDTMRIMRSLIRREDACLIVALHDLNLAIRYSDKVVVLNDGRVYDIGPPEKVITSEMIQDVYGVKAEILEDSHGLFVRSYDEDEDRMEDRA
ncbi:MAG: ABC transporter ATP-binding protein [Candidatus Methanomethylophilaceae archaeon]|nr:ABC transporter ATP-binding protein [Candidatus Methanomethylophilaceae archaeon]